MYINEIKLNDFRAFSNHDEGYCFKFSPHINCISGHNGVGKSTILAVLSNIGELKKKHGSHLNGRPFKGEYSELIKGDKRYDTNGDKITVSFANKPKNNTLGDVYPDKLDFRATFQLKSIKNIKAVSDKLKKEDKENTYEEDEYHPSLYRYRLIPKPTSLRSTESKLTFPTYYLGLSRLFPFGESDSSDTKSIIPKHINGMVEDYIKLLNIDGIEITEMNLVQLSDLNKKAGIGITTEDYNYLANSAGQDNLGQILLTIYSFANLKQSLGANYFGGVLIIDEIDATLHPGVQNRLVDYLEKKSKELELQIFFTTHSNTLMNHLIRKRDLNKSFKDSIQINYLTNSRGQIEIVENPTIKYINNNLTETYSGRSNVSKINIITEDEVAQNFFIKILHSKQFTKLSHLNIVNINGSWNIYMRLFNASPEAFKNFMFILDPDLNIPDQREILLKTISQRSTHIGNSIHILPGDSYIEKLIWEWVSNIKSDHNIFFDPQFEEQSITKDILINNGPNSHLYDSYPKEKNKLKSWYSNNISLIDLFIDYWIEDNKEIVDKFYSQFIRSFTSKI